MPWLERGSFAEKKKVVAKKTADGDTK